jgi:hypothetical protein
MKTSVRDPDTPNLFLGLPDPHQDPLVKSADPSPGSDPAIIENKQFENLDFYYFSDFFGTFLPLKIM